MLSKNLYVKQPYVRCFSKAKMVMNRRYIKKDYLNHVISILLSSTYIRQEIYLERLLESSVQLRIDKRLFRQNVSKVILRTSYLTSVLNHVRITTPGEDGLPSSRAFGTASRPSRPNEKNLDIFYVEVHIVIHTLSSRRSSVVLLSTRSK